MIEQINKRWQSLLLVTVAILIMLGASSSAFAQKSWNNKLPKPDFSAMEEYYEIVEYEYDFTASVPTFTVTAKKKHEKTPERWDIVWRDDKGVAISKYSLMFDPFDMQKAKTGEPIRASSYAPFKDKVVKTKIIEITEKLN